MNGGFGFKDIGVMRNNTKLIRLGGLERGSVYLNWTPRGRTLSCDFAHTINEPLKWLTQQPTLMQNHSGGDNVVSRC